MPCQGPATPGAASTAANKDGARDRLTAAPGSLSAAHASAQAFESAGSRPRVGALAAHIDAIKATVNKDRRIDASVIDTVNRMLDGKSDGFTHNGAVHASEQAIATLVNPR